MGGAWTGGAVSPSTVCVLAPNPGPMTLDGTNTWVLRAPGADAAIVVDPGPAGAPAHLEAVLQAAGGRVALTLLTHHHADHTGALDAWSALVEAPVRGAGHGPAWTAGERIAAGGLDLEVVPTPGHTPDSVCLLLPAEGALLTGDTVLGWGTAVVPWPDGDLGAYLASLDRLRALAADRGVRRLLPGHGPVIEDAAAALDELHAHRLQRLDQVRAALAAGARTPADVVAAVYGDLGPGLADAAAAIVGAQLAYLGHPPR